MTIASKLDTGFWRQHTDRYPSDPSDAPHTDPFAMSPEEEAAWKAAVAKREAERKAKENAEAAEQCRWERSLKILIGLLWIQIFFATVQLVAVTVRDGASTDLTTISRPVENHSNRINNSVDRDASGGS